MKSPQTDLTEEQQGASSALLYLIRCLPPHSIGHILAACQLERRMLPQPPSFCLCFLFTSTPASVGNCPQTLNLDRGVHVYVRVCSRGAMWPEGPRSVGVL